MLHPLIRTLPGHRRLTEPVPLPFRRMSFLSQLHPTEGVTFGKLGVGGGWNEWKVDPNKVGGRFLFCFVLFGWLVSWLVGWLVVCLMFFGVCLFVFGMRWHEQRQNRSERCGTICHRMTYPIWLVWNLGGGFKYFIFSPLPGEDSHFD